MSFDRKIAQLLDGVPVLRRSAKFLYLRLIYLLARRGELHYGLNPSYSINGFFGYYDKSPWCKKSSHLLFHSILDTETLALNILDLASGQVQKLGVTTAWNWQQGAMLQWLLGRNTVAFNALVGGYLTTTVIHVENDSEISAPMPIQTLHPDGNQALSLNYKKLHATRPEYGYVAGANNFQQDQDPDQDGIWHFGLFEGKPSLILSIHQLMQYKPREEMLGAAHKVNHIIYSPNGERFVFMHRWIGSRGKFSRLYVADNPDGANLRLLMDERMASHYCWRDDDHLLVYGRTAEEGDRYYLIDVNTGQLEVVGRNVLDKYGDGHPSYSPDGRWILTDTYPDKARMRHLLLYDIQGNLLHRIASFFAPWKFDGPNRVDLHPRWSPCGRYISVDSAHEGHRKMYILNVEGVVNQ